MGSGASIDQKKTNSKKNLVDKNLMNKNLINKKSCVDSSDLPKIKERCVQPEIIQKPKYNQQIESPSSFNVVDFMMSGYHYLM